ncbi:MAG TPA: hypothetical protein VNX28_19120 [Gemmataceae bacterium]|jgi:hypothetical protein|nr:hypothetical protein [Gemmataceae bacterium]
MDTEMLVDKRIYDGERLIKALAEKGVDVGIAFWLKMSDDGKWVLFLALPSVGAKGLAAAYSDVYKVLAAMEGIWIEMADIKVLALDDPVAKYVMSLRDRHRGQYALQLKSHRFPNLDAEEAYIYPAVKVSGRKTRAFAVRQELTDGQMKEVQEEIGTIPGMPGEDVFNKEWIELMNSKGGFDELASKYKGFALQFIK